MDRHPRKRQRDSAGHGALSGLRIYSKEMVARRLISLVVAVAVALAPGALEACQVSCLSNATHAAAAGSTHHHSPEAPMLPTGGAHVHHHAAETPAPQSDVVVASQPHPCDHGDDLPALSAALNGTLVAPAVVSVFEFPQIDAGSLRRADSWSQPSSARIALTTQLRV
jgi:hypothetical protein